jgi:hypothetical protein
MVALCGVCSSEEHQGGVEALSQAVVLRLADPSQHDMSFKSMIAAPCIL